MGSLHRNVIMTDPTDEKVLLGEILKQLQTTDPEELLIELWVVTATGRDTEIQYEIRPECCKS
jgi:hypothetical protein